MRPCNMFVFDVFLPILDVNPQKDNWQTAQTQITHYRMWCLIKVYTTGIKLDTGISIKHSNNKN